MRSLKLSAWALIFAVVLCSRFASGQQARYAENDQTTNAALREKAFALLESLAGQVNSLQSGENRARLNSNIAGSLWTHDEKRARALLISVEEDIRAGLVNQDGEGLRDAHTVMVFLRLREDTIERIAKHDPALAFAFFKATALISDKRLPYGAAERETALELRLAKDVAAANPEIALTFGRRSLERGLSTELLSVLKQLNKGHKDHALILYKEILSKLRDTDFTRDYKTLYFAQSLAQSFTPPAIDDAAHRELLNIFITTALANGCGNKALRNDRAYFCSQIASLMPQMVQADPLRAGELKHWTPAAQSMPPMAFYELNELAQSGTVEEILALATKYPQLANEVHWHAINKAEASGNIERARKLATDYIADPERRRLILERIDHNQKWASLDDERMAEVQRRVSEIREARERAQYLMAIANHIGAKDRKSALQLLSQASGIVEAMKPGKEQTEGQMALAMMYCSEKSDRGFAIMESVVPKLNDLVTAAVKLDGFDNRYVRDGEWNMTGEGGVGSLLTTLAKNAGYFAWCDFDRAVNLAGQFERAELRLMSQLKLAQAILAGPPKRFPLQTY